MAKAFDKIGWLLHVQRHVPLGRKDLGLAVLLCYRFTRRDGTGWLVELDKLAEEVGAERPGAEGMSRSQVLRALRKLCAAGVIVEARRDGGGRGAKARRAHDLVAIDGCEEAVEPERETLSPKPDLEPETPSPMTGFSGETLSPKTRFDEETLSPVTETLSSVHQTESPMTRNLPVSAVQAAQISPTGTPSGTPSGKYIAAARTPAHEPEVSLSPQSVAAQILMDTIGAQRLRNLGADGGRLRKFVTEQVEAGASHDTIALAVQLWDGRPDARPGLLPHLMADAERQLRPATTPMPTSTADLRAAQAQALKVPAATRKVAAGPDLAARLGDGQSRLAGLFGAGDDQPALGRGGVVDAEIVEDPS